MLAIASGLISAIAFVVYNWSVLFRQERRSVATWAIWAVIVILNTSSYKVASGDWWTAVMPLVNSVLSITTFIVVAIKGKFEIDRTDLAALGLGVLAGGVWVIFRSAASANLIIQLAIVIGFVPTWRGVWRGTVKERSLPWWLWSLAYAVTLVVVIMRWKGDWVPLIYPINCILLHASVPLLCSWRTGSLVPKEVLERELISIQRQIQQVSAETDRMEWLKTSIVAQAIDRGSPYEQERRATRQECISHNRWLIADLTRQEARLKKRLGIA